MPSLHKVDHVGRGQIKNSQTACCEQRSIITRTPPTPKADYKIRKSVVSDPGPREDLLIFFSFKQLVIHYVYVSIEAKKMYFYSTTIPLISSNERIYLIKGFNDWETALDFLLLPSNTAPSSFQFKTRVARWAADLNMYVRIQRPDLNMYIRVQGPDFNMYIRSPWTRFKYVH